MKGPIEPHLEAPLRDEQLQRIARKVQAARHGEPRRGPAPVLVGAALAALLVSAVGGWLFRSAPAGPLATASGRALPSTLTGAVAFSDGSQLTLDEGTRAEVVANQAGRLTLVLRSGRGRFEVNPASHRQWVVETGVASVEVLGTIFSVDRRPEGVHVEVERGVVLVRSDGLPDHVQRLEAGMSVFAPRPTEPAVQRVADPVGVALEPALHETALPDAGPLPAPASTPRAPKPSSNPEVVPREAPVTPPAWEVAARHGDFERAWALLAPVFVERLAHADTAELVLVADTARGTGRHPEAALALTRALELTPADATVAFTLARLELDFLERPDDAARHFEQVATVTPASPLRYDALVRRVEALQAAKQPSAALAAARAALFEFPQGVHKERLERMVRALESPTP
jgi:transmembrane sensor